ncbi:MAG: hypothetical protein JXA43_02080 [Candidatus Diapherotrites archaeon]|nr:hypothetical protein [Candidatus Diapherotrites archaeon]
MSSENGVGISGIAVAVPRICITAEEFENGRGIPNGKLSYLGIDAFGVPDLHEDSVTLGAVAARKVLEQTDTDLNDIGGIFYGLETHVDQTKGNSNYTFGALEDWFGKVDGELHLVDHKMACAAGAEALISALARVEGGWLDDKKALVIASDISKYEQESPGEQTQGAAAVAVLVEKDPKLMRIGKTIGVSGGDERDFFRPNWKDTPTVDGKHSNLVYLKHTKKSVESYVRRLNKKRKQLELHSEPVEAPSDNVDRVIYHIPYGDQAIEGFRHQIRHEWRAKIAKLRSKGIKPETISPEIAEIAKVIDAEPLRGAFPENDEGDMAFAKKDKENRKELGNTKIFREKFASQLEPVLLQPRKVGNSYTGSWLVGFHSLLENSFKKNPETGEKEKAFDLTGNIIGINSYGSGAESLTFSGTIMLGYEEIASQLELNEFLDARKEISFNQYRALHARNAPDSFFTENELERIVESIVEPKHGDLVFKGEDDGLNREGLRKYEWVKDD